jgi:hypothetical protein
MPKPRKNIYCNFQSSRKSYFVAEIQEMFFLNRIPVKGNYHSFPSWILLSLHEVYPNNRILRVSDI